MPEISRFFGIVVFFNFREHPPAHFHATYQGDEVSVDIETLRVQGRISPRARRLLLEWADMHRDELLRAWTAMRSGRTFRRIAPLE